MNSNIIYRYVVVLLLLQLSISLNNDNDNLVNAYQFIDKTIADQKDMYAVYETEWKCTSKMLFYFEDPTGITTVTYNHVQVGTQSTVFSSATERFDNVYFFLYPGNTQFTIEVATGDQVYQETINYHCDIPPQLDIEFLSNNSLDYSPSFIIASPITFLIRIKNVNKPQPPLIAIYKTLTVYELTSYAVTSDTLMVVLFFNPSDSQSAYMDHTFLFQLAGGQGATITHTFNSITKKLENTESSPCSFDMFPKTSTPNTLTYPEAYLKTQCLFNDEKRVLHSYKEGSNSLLGIYVEGSLSNPTFFRRLRMTSFSTISLTVDNSVYVQPLLDQLNYSYTYVVPPPPTINGASIGIDVSVQLIEFNSVSTNAIYQGDMIRVQNHYNYLSYPFGFTNGNSQSYIRRHNIYFYGHYAAPIPVSDYSFSITLSTPGTDDIAPQITSVKTTKIPNSPWVVYDVKITDDLSGFNYLEGFGDYTKLIRGSLIDGEYQFITLESFSNDPYSYELAKIFDSLNNQNVVELFKPLNIKLESFNFRFLNVSEITDIRFRDNDIDVTNQNVDNQIFIYTSNVDVNYKPAMIIYSFGKDIEGFKVNTGDWSDLCGCYMIPFTVPMNYPTGYFEYFLGFGNKEAFQGTHLYVQSLFGPHAALRVHSEYADLLGPIVTSLKTEPSNQVIVPDGIDTTISWILTIQDKYNGFKSGKISFVSSLDLVRYNFTFTSDDMTNSDSGGDIYNGIYQFQITVPSKCASQTFYIQYIELVDRAGYVSVHQEGGNYPTLDIYQPNYPFTFADDIKDYSAITIGCKNTEDNLSPPVLQTFTISPASIDAFDIGEFFNESRQVIFNIVTQDDNGLLLASKPRIYLHDQRLNVIHQDSEFVSSTSTTATFKCIFNIPYGFGYGSNIKISIYGIVDNKGKFNGYSIRDLANGGFPNTITLDQNSAKVAILSSKDVYTIGGDIIVVGKNFKGTESLLVDFKNGTIITLSNNVFYKDTVIVYNIQGEILVPEIVITLSYNNMYSNSLRVKPIIKQYYVVPPADSSSVGSSSLSSSTSSVDSSSSGSNETPEPNKPQTCNNNCGGIDHGVCTPNGCVCKSPWIGLDCLSQVIVIDPVINTTTPSTNITVPTNDKNTAIYYAIISVVALNELDKDKQLFKQHQFPQWIVNNNTISKYSQYTNSSYLYSSSFDYNNITTNINVSIDYFNVDTPVNITFASQIFTMNPYSLKYSVNISEYSFGSSLNTLQLVLLASIETEDNSDECSSKQFGDTVEPDSEYIKMQVNDHSLYGRFIKRGVVDGRIKTISNVQLDNQYNSISTQSQIQSYIGINIPFYKRSVQLDPDFSVLVDNRPASNNDNAICKKKSKLSTAQLAGIIIGAVGFAAVVIVSVSYAIFKHKKQKAFERNLDNKLKNIN